MCYQYLTINKSIFSVLFIEVHYIKVNGYTLGEIILPFSFLLPFQMKEKSYRNKFAPIVNPIQKGSHQPGKKTESHESCFSFVKMQK